MRGWGRGRTECLWNLGTRVLTSSDRTPSCLGTHSPKLVKADGQWVGPLEVQGCQGWKTTGLRDHRGAKREKQRGRTSPVLGECTIHRSQKTFPVCLLARRILKSLASFSVAMECHHSMAASSPGTQGRVGSGLCVVVAQGWSAARTVGLVPSPSVTTKAPS